MTISNTGASCGSITIEDGGASTLLTWILRDFIRLNFLWKGLIVIVNFIPWLQSFSSHNVFTILSPTIITKLACNGVVWIIHCSCMIRTGYILPSMRFKDIVWIFTDLGDLEVADGIVQFKCIKIINHHDEIRGYHLLFTMFELNHYLPGNLEIMQFLFSTAIFPYFSLSPLLGWSCRQFDRTNTAKIFVPRLILVWANNQRWCLQQIFLETGVIFQKLVEKRSLGGYC